MRLGHKLSHKNFVSSFDGNLSVRLDEDLILITRSGCMKGELEAKDFVLINSAGQKLNIPELLDFDQSTVASSETSMHLQIYENQPLAKSVFHAHPPTTVAYSVAFPEEKNFPMNFISELVLALGYVPIVPYQRPGTPNMGKALCPFLDESKVLILQFHGAVSWGENIEEAYRGLERIEHAAEIFLKAKAMGYVHCLPKNEIEELIRLRKKIGFKTL